MYHSGRKLGDFVLCEPIGEGGCAVVYRCEQPQLRRSAVVKILHERGQRSDAALDRFRREAQLASQLDHPYAAHVYAFGDEDDGLFWIAMELVQGTALDDWLAAHGPMPLAQFVAFFECVAHVVHAAHERGIIHRDLKPSNVMVIDRNGRMFPKLLDFGIAKLIGELALPAPEHLAGTEAVTTAPLRAGRRRAQRTRTDPAVKDHRLTRTSAKLGSTAYMSPEQWTDPQSIGAASDIYSLGVLAYEVLTGRKPFTAETTHEYYHQHVYAEVPPLGDAFPPEVDRVIRRALAKSPEARHGSALELAAELCAVLRLQPHEQLRASAQQWDDKRRPKSLLWGADVLADTLRSVPQQTLSPLECSFVVESQRRIRRIGWVKRALVAAAVMVAIGGFLYHAATQTRQARLETQLAQEQTQLAQEQARSAREMSEATVAQAELEQGRSALLHDEPEAAVHLGLVYQRGDHSPSTAFMLARALQPRLAEQARFAAAAGHTWSAVFSPDGQQIVTTDDGAAQVWDVQTHKRRFTLQHGDVYDARYSADHARLVTACGDGTVRIWDATTGALVRTLKKRQRTDGAPPHYFVATFSPDDRLVAAIDSTGAVTHVWDAASGVPLAELHDKAADFPAIAFSGDSRWLATSGGDEARVFNTRTWTPVFTIAGPCIRALSFEPAASRLVTGSASGDATIWEIPSGVRAHHLREIGAPVRAVAFSPDGKVVATGGGDGVAQFWDSTSGALRRQVNAIHGRILSIEFDPTSQLAVAAGDGGTVVIAEAIGMPMVVLDAPRAVIRAAHFDPTSRYVVSADWDGTAHVWDATSPYRRWGSPPIVDDCGLITSLEPDRRFIAVGCRDHPTRVWDTAHDQLIAELPSVTTVTGDFASAFPAVSIAGDRAAIARGAAVEVYELPSSRLLQVIRHPAAVDTVAFAPGCRDLVTGATDGSLLVTRDGREPIALPTSPGGVDAAGFLPDGRVVVTDVHGRLRIYDADRSAVVADLELPTRVRLLRPSPDGARLVTIPSFTGKTAAPLLWDLKRYHQIAELNDHVGQVFSARFVDDSREIVTAGDDGVARLWDSGTGRLLSSYRGTSRFLADAAIASNGSMIVAGGSDGALWFWDRATTRPLWKLQAHSSHIVGVHLEGDALVTRGFGGEVARWTFPNPGRVIEAALPNH